MKPNYRSIKYLRDEIEKESFNKKGSKTKTNRNKKNKDQN
jgi:hypothetical protein